MLAVLPRVVTVDGPAHVAGGWVLAHAGEPAVARFYEVDLTPVPNSLTTLVLAGLQLLGAGPDLAEVLLVAAYALLLPLALRYALRGVDPGAGWLAVVGVPFTAGYLFYYGFYNFCLAVGLALLAVGLALRQRTGWTPRSTAGLAALLLLTWSAHLLPVLVAGLVVAALALARVRTGGLLRSAGPVVLAGLPVLVLTLLFAGSDAADRGAPVWRDPLGLLLGLLGLGQPLVVYSRWEQLPALVLAVVLAALARQARPSTPERRALGWSVVGATVVYLVSPDRFGPEYGFLNDRLSVFPPLLLLLWAAGPPPSPRAARTVVGAVLGAALALALLRLPTEVRFQRDVAELLSVAPAVPTGSSLVRVQLARVPPVGGPLRNPYRDPLRHEPSRLAVLAGGVDVGHYEAALPYFPVRFRPADSPRARLDPGGRGLDAVPPRIDLAAAADVVDVVVVIGRTRAAPQVLQSPEARQVLADLAEGWRRVAVSERSGLAEVWVRRP